MSGLTRIDLQDKQGGKIYGNIKTEQVRVLDEMNKGIIDDGSWDEVEDLEEKLESFKDQFMDFDLDHSGDIDMMELKQMMEKLGQAKTHLELKKMIAEVDTTDSGTITYSEFINMMLGKRNSVLRIILMFEERKKGKERPNAPPPKKTLADLP